MAQDDDWPASGRLDKIARIERELAAIEASPAFVRSPVMKRLLRFIVNESRAGRGSQIKSYTLAVDGLGRPEDFDAQQDSYPRVQIGRLRKALEQHYLRNAPVEGLYFDLRPGGYEIHFVEAGEGISGDAAQSSAHPAGARWLGHFRNVSSYHYALALFILLCVAVLAPLAAGGLVTPWGAKGDGPYTELEDFPLVAVQPFAAGPDDGVDANLAGWLTARTTAALLGSRWIRVRSAPGLPPHAEAPDYELRNRVFHQDGRLVLAFELLDARDGTTVWARITPLELDSAGNVANMNDVLARLVSQAIDPGGAITARIMQGDRGTDPRPGYSCLVYVSNFWFDRVENRFDVADRCVQRTLALNPRFAPAWGAAAMLEYADNDFNYSGKGEGGADRAWNTISAAISLDPQNASLRSFLAYIHFRRGAYGQARTAALQSYELNPYSSKLLLRAGNVLFFSNDRELGLKLAKRAIATDPAPGPWYYQTLFFDAMARKQTKEAAGITASMPGLMRQNNLYTHLLRAILFAMEGNAAAARASWRQVTAIKPLAATKPDYLFTSVGVSKPYADQAISHLRQAGAVTPAAAP